MATVRLDQKYRALTRAIPDTFDRALAKFFGSGPKDIALAKEQHRAYRQALLSAGIEVSVLPADDNHPDCTFVEDQAVVIDGHVLLPVPGSPATHQGSTNSHPLQNLLQDNFQVPKFAVCMAKHAWMEATFSALAISFS